MLETATQPEVLPDEPSQLINLCSRLPDRYLWEPRDPRVAQDQGLLANTSTDVSQLPDR